ncbi:septation regulator SpoVG [Eubacterium xylanophilum]|uniref:septation regulator SpoVG n=1 Tax=Eubacterium xylanophilum TaxID=39497 RepID=UPI00047A0A7D|nr:septation regulator SpoVG [Eubacterium xylanophilum]MCR5798251.1 septation regulator SpoVG [Eubacterium sp.]
MQVTDIRIRIVQVQNETKMKAVASVTFDECFVVHDIKVINGDKGMFIAMPSKKAPNGEFRDVAHPINAEMRGMLQDKVLECYRAALNEVAQQAVQDMAVGAASDAED